MSHTAHGSPRIVSLASLLVAIVSTQSQVQNLQVDGFGLSIGSVSVGLPTSCTADAVLLRYLHLMLLTGRRMEMSPFVAPAGDVDALAVATRLDPATVRRRLDLLSY